MTYESPSVWLPETARIATRLRASRIDLAHAPDMALDAIAIRPSSREIERAGKREILEPRVMQVLVALTGADGAVVSRQDLVDRCWDGRAVGEDAINRCIGKLRRIAEADGAQSFVIETIPRVGYRLVANKREHEIPAIQPSAVSDTRGAGFRDLLNYRAIMPAVFVLLLVQQIGARLVGASPAVLVSDGMLIFTLLGFALSLAAVKSG
jgi:DNA-binding winged helix-turn-helix (wHTH) protein